MIVHFSGRVQGVGFRYTTRKVAEGFDVVGTVRNLPDGQVELIAEGTESELLGFLEEIETQSLPGFIEEREIEWLEPKDGYKGFRIIP